MVGVGIGTDNPNYLLDAYQSTGTDQDVFSVRGQTSAFLVQCSDLSAANPEWRLRTFTLEDLVFSPGDTGAAGEKVRIKASNGNVGIATATPRQTLDVDGGVHIQENLNVVGVSTFQSNVHLLDDDKLLLGGSAELRWS